MLTKDQILNANDLPTKVIPISEWGIDVIIKTMTGTERDAWEASLVKGKGKNTRIDATNVRAKLCVCVLVDEKGNRLFSDNDAFALGRKSSAALDKVFEIAQKLNGISDEDIEELAGNSKAAQSGTSTSGSQPTSAKP